MKKAYKIACKLKNQHVPCSKLDHQNRLSAFRLEYLEENLHDLLEIINKSNNDQRVFSKIRYILKHDIVENLHFNFNNQKINIEIIKIFDELSKWYSKNKDNSIISKLGIYFITTSTEINLINSFNKCSPTKHLFDVQNDIINWFNKIHELLFSGRDIKEEISHKIIESKLEKISFPFIEHHLSLFRSELDRLE